MNDDEWEAMLKRVAERQGRSAPPPVTTANFQRLPTIVASQRPQPIDYGLTRDDLNLYGSWESCRLDDGKTIRCIGTRPDDRYKEGRRWFASLRWRGRMQALCGLGWCALVYGGLMIYGGWWVFGLYLLAFGSVCMLPAIIPLMIIERLRKRARPTLEKYWEALHAYDDNKAAAEAAARKAAHDAELRKRSYWTVPRWLRI